MAEWLAKYVPTKTTALEVRQKKIPEVIVRILHNRGYTSAQHIETYFAPALSDLHDPFLFDDMEKAVDRIMRALQNKERILVHGDYDTDGITGTALVVSALKKLGGDVEYYIPHRLKEGYGLSSSGINRAIKQRCHMIITVDCGITALNEIQYAQEKQIDVIVCDHHKPDKELPRACALLNAKIPGSGYPFTELAGVGVSFKLLQALSAKLKRPCTEMYEDLDLVALGTVVDIVPLIDENRIMVKYGMNKLFKSKKAGFQALLQETGLKKGVTAYHLGFIIGPRVNACGRLHDAKEALELFLTHDKTGARERARNLSRHNTQRQSIEARMYQDAKALVEKQLKDDRIIVAGQEGWHPGVVGIVASKISEEYYRPVILLALEHDVARGSARSITGFDITSALSTCQDILTTFGGHTQAAGLELERRQISALRTRINEHARTFEDSIFQEKKMYDLKLDLNEISEEVVYFLKFFEPTGIANPQPVFLGEGLEVVGVPRVVGTNHLKCALRKNSVVFPAIAYGKADDILNIEVGKTKVDCLYSVSEDSFLGKKKVILKIRDMRQTHEE